MGRPSHFCMSYGFQKSSGRQRGHQLSCSPLTCLWVRKDIHRQLCGPCLIWLRRKTILCSPPTPNYNTEWVFSCFPLPTSISLYAVGQELYWQSEETRNPLCMQQCRDSCPNYSTPSISRTEALIISVTLNVTDCFTGTHRHCLVLVLPWLHT